MTIFIGRGTKTHIFPTKSTEFFAKASSSNNHISLRIINHSTTATTTTQLSKMRVEFPPLDLFDPVQICSGLDSTSNPRLESSIECGVDRISVTRSASVSLVTTWTSLTSGRALHCCRKNAFNSMRLVLRVGPLRVIVPSAAESCRVTRLLGIAYKLQQPVPLLSHAHAFTGSRERSDQLSFATAQCDRRLFSARRGDRVPTKFAWQPRRSATHAESVSVASPVLSLQTSTLVSQELFSQLPD